MSSAADQLFLTLALDRLRAHWWDAALREPCLHDIARYAGALGGEDATAALLDSAQADLLTIALHGADVLRGYAVPLATAPYVMTVAQRAFAAPGITIDADGLRVTTAPPEAHAVTTAPVLIVGNSTSWGVGVSGDAHHVGSVLASAHGVRVRNASVKGSNAIQHWLMAESACPDGGTVVVVGGVLDLIFALAWPRDAQHGALPFWGVDDRDLTEDATADGAWAVLPDAYDHDAGCARIAQALDALGGLTRRRGARVCFVLQPHLDFLPRAATSSEARLAEAFSRELGTFRPVHRAGVLRAHAEPFSHWLAQQCRRAGIAFVDANASPEFAEDTPCFLDHIHLDDVGHVRLAAVIARALDLPASTATRGLDAAQCAAASDPAASRALQLAS